MSKHVIIYMPRVGEDAVQWAEADDSGYLTSEVQNSTLEEVAGQVDGRRVTLVLPADDVLLSEAVVPGGSAVRAQQAIPFALEEQLADDVDELHFALGAKERGDKYPVAIISRLMMDTVAEQCSVAGLRPSQMVPETLALPQLEGSAPDIRAWTALLDGNDVIVRLSEQKGFATDAGMAGLMLAGARQELDEDVTAALVIFRTNDDSVIDVPDLIEVEHRSCDNRLTLYASGLSNSTHINLLQGEYNPKKSFDKTWKMWRWTAALAACLLAVLILGKWLDVRQLAQQEGYLDEQIGQAFEQALPNTRMQRPQRQVQAALEKAGGTNFDGFTSRLSQIAASLATQPQTEIRTIGYRNGRFDLDLITDDVPTLDALKSELGKRGSLDMSVQSANRENNAVRGRVRIE